MENSVRANFPADRPNVRHLFKLNTRANQSKGYVHRKQCFVVLRPKPFFSRKCTRPIPTMRSAAYQEKLVRKNRVFQAKSTCSTSSVIFGLLRLYHACGRSAS